jgi:hypothetical protein
VQNACPVFSYGDDLFSTRKNSRRFTQIGFRSAVQLGTVPHKKRRAVSQSARTAPDLAAFMKLFFSRGVAVPPGRTGSVVTKATWRLARDLL